MDQHEHQPDGEGVPWGCIVMSPPGREIEVRAAVWGDAGLLAKLGRETFDEAFADLINDRDLSSFADKRFGLRQQTKELGEPGTTFFIAWHDGRIAGYARLCESVPPPCIASTRVVELERLYLFTRWYGQGVAQALMDACLAEACKKNFDVIWLDVWDENQRALAFYRKYLFRLVGERPYVVGAAEQRHLLMCRRLEYAPGHDCAK